MRDWASQRLNVKCRRAALFKNPSFHYHCEDQKWMIKETYARHSENEPHAFLASIHHLFRWKGKVERPDVLDISRTPLAKWFRNPCARLVGFMPVLSGHQRSVTVAELDAHQAAYRDHRGNAPAMRRWRSSTSSCSSARIGMTTMKPAS